MPGRRGGNRRRPGLFRLTSTTLSFKIVSVKKEEVTELAEFPSLEQAKEHIATLIVEEGTNLHVISSDDNRAVYTEKR